MKKITLTLLAFVVTCFMYQVSAQTFTATDTPQTVGPNSGTVTASIASSTAVGVVGLADGEFSLDNVFMNINHSWADDLDIRLTSPGGGVTVDLSTDNGGRFGLNPAADLTFTDGSVNDVTSWGSFSPAADYQAEGGLLNTLFAGEPANGDWTLTVTDDTNGDFGNLNAYSITLSENLGLPPVIACPADIMLNTTGGVCTGVANWADPIAFDPEDGPIAAVQIAGPTSGDALAPGVYVVTYEATDSVGNSASCSFNVTVADMEAPVAVCQDISVDLDASGSFTITAADLDNGSSDNCGIVTSTMAFDSAGTNTLDVGFMANNAAAGNMFDIMALNAITVNSFDISPNVQPGEVHDYAVYFKVGSWIGSETTPGDWTLLASPTGIVTVQSNAPTALDLSLGIDVAAGELVAFYITSTDGSTLGYTGATGTTGVGNLWASDDNIEFYEGAGKGYPFGSTFAPRVWNGQIQYDSFTTPFSGTFDCSNVGTNNLIVTHTDAAGNSTSCTSTVTVSDVTAPEIVCIGQPATINASVSGDNLGAPISNILAPAESAATVSESGTIGDNAAILSVELDITHTWDGDLTINLTSPTGTVLVLSNQNGGSGDDFTGTVFADGGDDITAGTPPFTGTFEPEGGTFADAFAGEEITGDWVLSVVDGFGGDDGTLNAFNFNYSYDVVGAGLEVVLDANGLATINASDLLLTVDEPCGWTASVAGDLAQNSLTTTFDGGNGQAGNMFDVTAINDLTIDSFDVSIDDGITDTVEVYVKAGTWVGFEEDAAAWTLLGTVADVTSAGQDVPTPLNQTFGYDVMAGDTVAFYVTLTTSTAINYTNGTTVGALFVSDANMEVFEGAGKVYPFANTFQPRNFNGNIVYSTGGGASATMDLDCSMLGENLIEITVTDDNGNVSTCMASVIVLDETSPILVCADATIELGADGTATVDPLDLLATVMGSYNVLIIGSDSQSGDEGLTDITVPVTDAETVSFDWDYVLNDVPGFESFGYLLNGTYTELIDPTVGNQQGSETIALDAGDVFGFRAITSDNLFGNNETVISNFLPGFTGQFDPANWTVTLTDSDGSATFVEIPGGQLSFDACGITEYAVSVTEVSCADVGTPVTITVFATDGSGNIASCTSTVTVVDTLAPVVTCPGNVTVDPGAGNLFYEVPDYIGTGDATATDNCTDPVTITTQDPAAGSLVSDGTYTVTITGEDASGNVGTCSFDLTVESVLGVESNELNNAISMYPNPAQDQVTISNSSNIQLEKAVIYDMNGKMLNQIDLSTMQGEQVINISDLATGVYVVQLTSDTSSATKRLIKK